MYNRSKFKFYSRDTKLIMFPFCNKWNKDTHTVTIGARKSVSFSQKIEYLGINNIFL